MTGFEELRRKATIAGTVRDEASGKPLAGAPVEIVKGPPAFQRRRETLAAQPGWSRRRERPDRTLARWDGSYFFLDLPAGSYEVRVTAPAGPAGQARKQKAKVPEIKPGPHDFALKPKAEVTRKIDV